MEVDPKDYDIVKLLTNLKKAEDQYPADLFASRRQGYVRRVAEIGVGLGVSAALKTTVKNGSGTGAATTTIGGILETILLVAIVAEASAAAYVYRDQIADVIQSFTSNSQIQEIASPASDTSPVFEPAVTDLPVITETLTPTGTPLSTLVANTENGGNNQAISTPKPNGNNGLHLGQTPKPERTKPGGGNNNGGGNGNGNGNDNGNGNGR